MLLFISLELIRYESSRGRKIEGTKPNQTNPGTRPEKKSRESKQKKTNKVASEGHRRQKGTYISIMYVVYSVQY